MEREGGDPVPARNRERGSRWWYLLLAIPFVALLYPPIYATNDPELFGFPFFYWYQFAWVPITAALIYVVYRNTRTLPPPRDSEGPR